MSEPVRRQLHRDELAIDPLDAARLLLGCVLESSTSDGLVGVRLTEVEAYRGAEDPASHCYRGRTARNGVMFGPAGHLYVYFVYGMHFCANVVCLVDGVPGAVLLRAGEVCSGMELARKRRQAVRRDAELARGPARLASALGIGREDNGADVVAPSSPLRLLAGDPVGEEDIETGPRVGVAAATNVPWRFWLRGSASVSQYRRGGKRRARS
ncbi:MAG: DNA-3-methyladenine glycosylase [Sciscionella sp.]